MQGVRIPSAILKIVFRHIYLFFLNAVWALTSGGFRVVSDTLVLHCFTYGHNIYHVNTLSAFHLSTFPDFNLRSQLKGQGKN